MLEKLRYVHQNPVKRGLVSSPEDWPWSSFRHSVSGAEGVVEIESQWTARKRERLRVTIGSSLKMKTPALSLQKRERQGRGTPKELV